MEKATVRELAEKLKGKRVFLRADLNVPQDESGKITDDTRIRESLYTLKYLLDQGARVVLCSHLGRPKDKTEDSLAPVAERLRKLMPKVSITLAKDCIGKEVEAQVAALKNGQVLLLENIRHYKEETKNDPEFSKQLSKLADYYVNDAFGAAHRAHASTAGIAAYIPAVSGFLLEKEIKILGDAIGKPKRPLTVVLGGKKVSDKIGVIDNLLKIADRIIIGGGMAFTFVKAQGGEIGDSFLEKEGLDERLAYCRNVFKIAKERKITLDISQDCVCGDKYDADAHTLVAPINKIPSGWQGLDVGPKTVESFKKTIAGSGTIIWNGPVGVSEFEKFANGTIEMGKAIVAAGEKGAVTIAGGGDTAAAIVKFGFGPKFTHISTGGGASLELLEGKILPGVAALNDKGAVRA